MDKFFKGFDVEYVERKNNEEADALAKAAAKRQLLPADVFYEVITKPSIRSSQGEAKLIQAITSQDWRAPLMAFMNGYYQQESKAEQSRLQQRARSYLILQGELYKSGISSPLVKCLSQEHGKKLLHEIHSGICGSQIGACVLVAKAVGRVFSGPTW